MSQQVMLEVPQPLLEQAQAVAAQTKRPLEAILIEWLDRAAAEVPVTFLSDEQILTLRDQQFAPSEQTELSELLALQREGQLQPSTRKRLATLLSQYRRQLVRKAEALQVAVARGLQPPLE